MRKHLSSVPRICEMTSNFPTSYAMTRTKRLSRARDFREEKRTRERLRYASRRSGARRP